MERLFLLHFPDFPNVGPYDITKKARFTIGRSHNPGEDGCDLAVEEVTGRAFPTISGGSHLEFSAIKGGDGKALLAVRHCSLTNPSHHRNLKRESEGEWTMMDRDFEYLVRDNDEFLLAWNGEPETQSECLRIKIRISKTKTVSLQRHDPFWADDVKYVFNRLMKRKNVFIAGLPGIGRTAFLNSLQSDTVRRFVGKTNDFIVCYANAKGRSVKTLAGFISMLLDAVGTADVIRSWPEAAAKLQTLRTSFQLAQATRHAVAVGQDVVSVLREIFHRPIVFLVDDFDSMFMALASEQAALLEFMTLDPNCLYVAAGGDVRDWCAADLRATVQDAFNGPRWLKPLSEIEASRWLEEHGVESEYWREKLIVVGGGWPSLLTALAQCREIALDLEDDLLSTARKLLNEYTTDLSEACGAIWIALSAEEQSAAKVFAGGRAPERLIIARNLEDKRIFSKQGEVSRLRFQSPLFRAYVERMIMDRVAGLSIKEDEEVAYIDGERKETTRDPYRLLTLLYQNPNRVFSGEQIFLELYKPKNNMVTDQDKDKIRADVKRLREDLEGPKGPYKYIRTGKNGHGYYCSPTGEELR